MLRMLFILSMILKLPLAQNTEKPDLTADSITFIVAEASFWGGIRTNSVSLSNYNQKIFLTVEVDFDKFRSKGRSKRKTIEVPDTVWKKGIDIIKSSQSESIEYKSDEHLKNDVQKSLRIYTGIQSNEKIWNSQICKKEIERYLYQLVDIYCNLFAK